MAEAFQSPLSMEFSRQEYCCRSPFPPPGGLPNLGIEAGSPALQADSLLSEPPGKPWWEVEVGNKGLEQAAAGRRVKQEQICLFSLARGLDFGDLHCLWMAHSF